MTRNTVGYVEWIRLLFREIRWSYFLIAPAGCVVVVAMHLAGLDFLLAKRPHEILALVLVAAAFFSFARRWRRGDGDMFPILTFAAGALFLRELHFDFSEAPIVEMISDATETMIFVCLGVVVVWCVAWRDRVTPNLTGGSLTPWLAASFFAYFVALVIQRRAFKGLPMEQELHVPLEEFGENLAHTLFLIASLARAGGPGGARPDGAEAREPDSAA